MVYCGKPSRGCENCRKLHKRCDERRPACSRCTRLKKTCLGYRDQSDLIFRDESTRTRSKHRQYTCTPDSHHHDASLSRFTVRDERVVHKNWVFSVQPLLFPEQDASLCYFFHTTLGQLSHGDPVRVLHLHLPNLYAKSDPTSALRFAAEAISYAASSKFIQKAAILSRERYVRAINAVGKAIHNPLEARNDQTLYAVLLLSGYETMLPDPSTPPAWGAHVNGAAAIIKFRNDTSSHTSLSRGLFGFIRKSVVIGQMQMCLPMDEVFLAADAVPSSCQSPEDELISKLSQVPELQYHSSCLFDQSRGIIKADVENLLDSARSLDYRIRDWTHTLDTTWSYTAALSLDVEPRSRYTPRHIHRYHDFYTARVWNVYRVSRLIVQSIIIRAASWLSTSTDHNGVCDEEKTGRDSVKLVDDICASVSFLMGDDLSRLKLPTTGRASNEAGTSWTRSKDSDQAHSGRYSLIWPLYVTCGSDLVPGPQRNWMQMQLRRLAELGEAQAHFACHNRSRLLSGRRDDVQFDCV